MGQIPRRSAYIAVGAIGLFGVAMISVPTFTNAQGSGNAFSGYSSQNANKPIDIESDRLEVDDKTNIATFTGNVSATQGDYNLKSQKLEVTYAKAGEADDDAPAKPVKPVSTSGEAKKPASAKGSKTEGSASDPLSSGQVKFVKATGGRVVVTSLIDDQKAIGNQGFFDVKAQKITMTGDVLLTQKGNVVKGEKLNIDLTTGRAVVDPDKGRVRAILKRDGSGTTQGNPMESLTGKKKKNEKAADPPEPKPKAKSGSGWQTQSE